MAEKKAKKKPVAKTKTAKSKPPVIDPFATIAEDVAAVPLKPKRKEPSSKKAVAAPKAEAAPAVEPKKRTARTRAKTADKPPTSKPAKKAVKEPTLDVTAELAEAAAKVELSPVFKALAEPKLPELQRENRARLMMQSPTELYFYWSVRENPYHLLRSAFGRDTGTYTLVLKLTELRTGTEEIHPVEADGNWWFMVEPDGDYRAEIGFYAPNRPYFRILHSNTVETPRRAPSPHPAADAEWRVTARKFAEVLDVAGFTQDAFDVAMAGDDHFAAQETTHAAFSRFIGKTNGRLHSIAAEDMRYTMVALAAGLKLDDIRWRISPSLFAVLQANADRLEADKARIALSEHFDIDETEFVEESFGPSVHGGSLVNFPRTLKPRRALTQYHPFSSHSLR